MRVDQKRIFIDIALVLIKAHTLPVVISCIREARCYSVDDPLRIGANGRIKAHRSAVGRCEWSKKTIAIVQVLCDDDRAPGTRPCVRVESHPSQRDASLRPH